MDAVKTPAKFEVRSFTRSWDGVLKKFGQSRDMPTLSFLPILRGFVRMDPVNILATA